MSEDSPRLSIIPGWVATHPGIKGLKDLQVLCVLGQNANRRHGWTRRSQVTIAKQLDCARSTVQASINRLVEIGAVERREVESENGRDSAHWYRVIYDGAPAGTYDFDAYQAEEDQEYGPISAEENDTPPAGIPAPPAGPRPAPPAGPEPAPMLNTYPLTPPDQKEGEGAGERVKEENPKAVRREFERFWKAYPASEMASHDAALAEWWAMTAAERAECMERTPDFLKAAKKIGGRLVYPSVYLKERKWRMLDDPRSDVAPPSPMKPFSRGWTAKLLAELCKPMATTGWPSLTKFQEMEMRDAERASAINRDRKRLYGWPTARAMCERLDAALVPGPLLVLGETFVQLHRDSDEAQAWRALAERMGWPWLPVTKHEWLYLPPGRPEDALIAFKEKLGGKDAEHAA